MAATLRLPGDVLAQFDVALDLTRRDELELVGTEGRLVVPEPWLCRASHLELSRDGRVERVPVDPEGAFALTDPDHDVYRVELDTVSAAIAGGGEPSFGRSDAIAQATVIEALYRSAELGTPVAVGSAGWCCADVPAPKTAENRSRATLSSPEAYASSPTVPR